jgi:hypothetical protein
MKICRSSLLHPDVWPEAWPILREVREVEWSKVLLLWEKKRVEKMNLHQPQKHRPFPSEHGSP